ncbi:hypothetical protein JTE90_013429 [Oedothorax gibbosus]|uniref:Uncharacterized protein n=1 Tax=Oedothorax gibbosus TaxID=931172 RepID=A0AAV6UFT3_9ARAC|nr:hypothetical protein JTE90_013429 [Oedothorax gibbosus]
MNVTIKDRPKTANGHSDANVCINQELPCLNPNNDYKVNQSKRRLLKNLLAMSFFYCAFYTGFWGLTNLQSTMNAASGIGPDSQAVIYVFSMASSLFLPEITIGRFGCKRVIVVATLISLPYIAANLFIRWDTMLIFSALFGLANGPFSAAMSMYTDEIARRYQKMINAENVEFVMACFFGVYSSSIESTQVWGNAISFLVLRPGTCTVEPLNVTSNTKCGIFFEIGSNETNSNLDPPSNEDRIILITIYVSMGIVALVFAGLALDPLYNDLKKVEGCRTAINSFVTALKQLKNINQTLLVPLAIFIGVQSAFYSNVYTEVRCCSVY